MSKNQYTPFETKWNYEQWSGYCPNLEYRVKRQEEFPPFFPPKLTKHFNCAMVAASGNGQQQTFVFQGYRVDGTELDEQQYIVTFDRESGQHYAGFIDHADYAGRTSDIPNPMLESMGVSGINVNFHFDRKPPYESGTLKELSDAGLISGFTNSIAVQNAKHRNA